MKSWGKRKREEGGREGGEVTGAVKVEQFRVLSAMVSWNAICSIVRGWYQVSSV